MASTYRSFSIYTDPSMRPPFDLPSCVLLLVRTYHPSTLIACLVSKPRSRHLVHRYFQPSLYVTFRISNMLPPLLHSPRNPTLPPPSPPPPPQCIPPSSRSPPSSSSSPPPSRPRLGRRLLPLGELRRERPPDHPHGPATVRRLRRYRRLSMYRHRSQRWR